MATIKTFNAIDRIGQALDGFQKGVSNYAQGQNQQYQIDQQAEAKKRQAAIDGLNVEAKLTEATGRNFLGSGVGEQYMSGQLPSIGELMQSMPKTPKSEREAQDAELDREYKKAKTEEAKRRSLVPKLSEEQKLDLKIQKEQEAKAAERANPQYKLEKLGGEGRGKVGALASGLQAIDQMSKASLDGFGPQHVDSNTPIIGRVVSDNPYSESERVLSEVVGRLQSGGAIGEQEIKTFRAMGPRPGDDHATRVRKLGQQRDFLRNKLTAFSITDGDLDSLGFKTVSDYRPKTISQSVGTGQAAPASIKDISKLSREEKIRILNGG